MSRGVCLCFVILFIGNYVGALPKGFNRLEAKADNLYRGVNGGTSCAACTVVVALVEQLSEIYNETVAQSISRLCQYLPSDYQSICREFGDFLLPLIIDQIIQKETPDVVCHSIGLCFTEAGHAECSIFPPPKEGIQKRLKQISLRDNKLRYSHLRADICDLPGLRNLCDWIKSIFDNHEPGLDVDGDSHSTTQTLRGVSWRGKDCDDSDPLIHPGAFTRTSDINKDANCNGIYGVDGATGTPYEDLLCKDSQSMGVAILGDSVGAHFHIPEEWLDARRLSVETFKDLTFILENELDWPELSSTTGYKNSTYSVTKGPTHSIYHHMWLRNRCNHRDYLNIAVNGADSSNMLSRVITSLRRDPANSKPLLVFYALVGNDVCNGHPDTFAHMTTPTEMRENFIKALQYLDAHIPAGSHLIVNGLVDGRILFNTLHDRIHPIGRFRNDVTYSQLYDYLSCLQVSPCNGYMTTNQTVRDLTRQRAVELNAVLQNVSASYQSKVYDINYVDIPIQELLDKWAARGGEDWQLIEPVDGFHTSQYGQSVTAEYIWEYLSTKLPSVIGPDNPKNSQIEALFGNQGGYE